MGWLKPRLPGRKWKSVGNTVGLAIAAGVFLAIRLPFIADEYSLTAYGACTILLAWCLTLVFCVLLKMLIYIVLLVAFSLLGAVVFFFGLRENELSADSVRIRDAISSWGIMMFLIVAIVEVL